MRFLILFGFIGASCASAQTTRPLFNGKDLSGWYTFLKDTGKNSDPKKIFQVHDGVIHIYKDAEEGSPQPFGYLASAKEFGDCRIRFEYMWGTRRFAPRTTKRRDSGFLYFVTGPDKVWPASVECQIQENDVGDTYAIATIVSATVDPATASEKQPTFKDGGVAFTTRGSGNDRVVRSQMLEKPGWNSVEVILSGDTAVHIVNGKVNMKLSHIATTQPTREGLTRGRILFQAEGAEVMYRNIEVAGQP